MEKVHFILTGWTIDSYYHGIQDTAIPRGKSIVPKYLKFLHLEKRCIFTEVCMKDSRALDTKDREKILKTIQKSKYSKIIITHGTYTLPDTARFLKHHIQKTDATIILTGSMVPLEWFTPSDAPFNLGYCLSEIQHKEPGIYGCMNGTIYSPEEMIKDLSTWKFASLYDHEWVDS